MIYHTWYQWTQFNIKLVFKILRSSHEIELISLTFERFVLLVKHIYFIRVEYITIKYEYTFNQFQYLSFVYLCPNNSSNVYNRIDKLKNAIVSNRESLTKSFFDRKDTGCEHSLTRTREGNERLLGRAVSGACISNDVVATGALPRLGFRTTGRVSAADDSCNQAHGGSG